MNLMQNHNPQQNPRPDQPKNEEIARLAYAFFESEGRLNGCALEHWLRAERQLSQECASGKKPQQSTKRRISPTRSRTLRPSRKATAAI